MNSTSRLNSDSCRLTGHVGHTRLLSDSCADIRLVPQLHVRLQRAPLNRATNTRSEKGGTPPELCGAAESASSRTYQVLLRARLVAQGFSLGSPCRKK